MNIIKTLNKEYSHHKNENVQENHKFVWQIWLAKAYVIVKYPAYAMINVRIHSKIKIS
jgi:hypothetical protein